MSEKSMFQRNYHSKVLKHFPICLRDTFKDYNHQKYLLSFTIQLFNPKNSSSTDFKNILASESEHEIAPKTANCITNPPIKIIKPIKYRILACVN